MEIFNINDAAKMQNHHNVDARKLLVEKDVTFVYLELKPGDTISPHPGEGDTYFYVLDGVGIADFGGEKSEISSNSLIKSPAGNLHGWRNQSDKNLSLLGIKMN